VKIAHVLRRLSFADWGGTEQVVWNIARAQLAEGHDVRIYATNALCAVPREVRDGLEIVRFKHVYPWWPMPRKLAAELDLKGGNPFVPGLGRALKAWKPDVIHCHAMARIAELCMRTAKKCGAKCIVSLHGGNANVPQAEATSLMAPTRGLLPWGKALDYAMGWVRRVPDDADGVVCVGSDEYEIYSRRMAHAMFLPNGVDVPLFEKARREGRCRDASALNVVCVARIDAQKNQMMLVEALARNPGMNVRLAGPVTQPQYREELEKRAQELGVASRLAILGALEPGSEALLAEYRRADVFVLPSRHEPFGIVVLEAWAAGLPVVASNVGGLGRLCAAHEGAALVFEPGDGAMLDAALADLRENPARADSLSANAVAAAKEYDWRVLARKLEEFYRTA